MCYFIYVRVTPQRQHDEAKARQAVQEAAAHQHLYLLTRRPDLMIANNGHCACDLVLKEKRLGDPVMGFVREVAGRAVVKSVEVGYRWSEAMPGAPVRRLSVEEFAALSDASGLEEGVWYHINDLSKYGPGNSEVRTPTVSQGIAASGRD